MESSRPSGQLHHQIVGLPAGAPSTNFLLKVLGIAGPTSGRANEVERLKPLWGGLLWETFYPGWGRGMSPSRPLANPTAAPIEGFEEPTEADEDPDKEDGELRPTNDGPITSKEEKTQSVQRI